MDHVSRIDTAKLTVQVWHYISSRKEVSEGRGRYKYQNTQYLCRVFKRNKIKKNTEFDFEFTVSVRLPNIIRQR